MSVLRFDDFELDLGRRDLRKRGKRIKLAPQPLGLLALLVGRTGEIVTRQEIEAKLWHGTKVSEHFGINRSVWQVRTVLGDHRKKPRYIETIRGRGYRFLRAVKEDSASVSRKPRGSTSRMRSRGSRASSAADEHPSRDILIAREHDLNQLQAAFTAAQNGSGQLVCVTGEGGLGKTSLVKRFLQQLEAQKQSFLAAEGKCSQPLARTNAYLPLLEFLEALTASVSSDAIDETLRAVAPSWRRLVWPGEDSSSAAPPQERLKREFVAFLSEVSHKRPAIVFLEDLHWADLSTIDILNYVCDRPTKLRVLIVLTYRPSQLLEAGHAFLKIKPDLQAHGKCREVALKALTADEVKQYLELRFTGHTFPLVFFSLIHGRTEGNPLFMVNLLRHFVDQGFLAKEEGRWHLVVSLDEIREAIPASIQEMVRAQVSRPSRTDRQILLGAAIQGVDFESRIIADVLSMEPAIVEERLQALQVVYALVEKVDGHSLPDGALSLRYRFGHALFQEEIYGSVAPSRKMMLSRKAAEALVGHYGDQSPAIASLLAFLFEVGRSFSEAIQYILLAARTAAEGSAYEQVSEIVDRGLRLIQSLPKKAEKAPQELALLNLKAISVMTTQGFHAPQLKQIYSRAEQVAEGATDTPEFVRALYPLWTFRSASDHLASSRKLAERLVASTARSRDVAMAVQARFALGVTLLHQGEIGPARKQLAQACAIYDTGQRPHNVYFDHLDPLVSSRCNLARALSLSGYPDQSLEEARQALEFASEGGHTRTLGYAYIFMANVHHHRGENEDVVNYCEQAVKIAKQHDLVQELIWATLFHAWGLGQQGQTDKAISLFQSFLNTYRGPAATKFLCLYAQIQHETGLPAESRATLQEAFDLVATRGERYFESELYRVKGESLLTNSAGAESAQEDAVDCFKRAINIASRQGAKSLELRAATSLGRLLLQMGQKDSARKTVVDSYSWFNEGFATRDLREARALLTELPKS